MVGRFFQTIIAEDLVELLVSILDFLWPVVGRGLSLLSLGSLLVLVGLADDRGIGWHVALFRVMAIP